MKTGKTIIKDKVYFEPDGLEKPNRYIPDGYCLSENAWKKQIKEYETSKQLIEVENVVPHLMPRLNEQKVDVYYDVIFSDYNFEQIKNNQNCKAEIENNKATIIELL